MTLVRLLYPVPPDNRVEAEHRMFDAIPRPGDVVAIPGGAASVSHVYWRLDGHPAVTLGAWTRLTDLGSLLDRQEAPWPTEGR